MIHEMNLNEKPFNNIKNGIKRIELRLLDEKRKNVNLKDIIKFYKLPERTETMQVKVAGLLNYNSFEELFKDVDYNICGPANNLEEKLSNIHKIYSIDEENKYGVLGISIELI